MSTNEGLGAILKRFGRSVMTILGVGSVRAEQGADALDTVDVKLERLDEAAEQDAQIVLDAADGGLTGWETLNAMRAATSSDLANWTERLEVATEGEMDAEEGSEQKAKYVRLGEEAGANVDRLTNLLAELDADIEEARPEMEATLDAIEHAGHNKQQALSNRERLRIADSTAEAKLALSKARSTGAGSQADELQRQINAEIMKKKAKAAAAQTIAAHMPSNPEDTEYELDKLSQDKRVDSLRNAMKEKIAAKRATTAPSA